MPGENPSWAADTPTATAKSGRFTPAPTPLKSEAIVNEGPETIPAPSPTVVLPTSKAISSLVNRQRLPPKTRRRRMSELRANCRFAARRAEYWLRADYLMWWTNGTRLPPLVTTSPQGTPVAQAGVLARSNRSLRQPNDRQRRPRGRPHHDGDVAGQLPQLECRVRLLPYSANENYNYDSGFSTGDPILARPFFNVQTNAQASQLVAYPGQAWKGPLPSAAPRTFTAAERDC